MGIDLETKIDFLDDMYWKMGESVVDDDIYDRHIKALLERKPHSFVLNKVNTTRLEGEPLFNESDWKHWATLNTKQKLNNIVNKMWMYWKRSENSNTIPYMLSHVEDYEYIAMLDELAKECMQTSRQLDLYEKLLKKASSL